MAAQQNATGMKLAVLTSGGDSAGMNAVVRAVVRFAITRFDLLMSTTASFRKSSRSEVVKRGLSEKVTKALFAATLMQPSSPQMLTFVQRMINPIPMSFFVVICDLEMESR
jgi:Phosphofructokinase